MGPQEYLLQRAVRVGTEMMDHLEDLDKLQLAAINLALVDANTEKYQVLIPSILVSSDCLPRRKQRKLSLLQHIDTVKVLSISWHTLTS